MLQGLFGRAFSMPLIRLFISSQNSRMQALQHQTSLYTHPYMMLDTNQYQKMYHTKGPCTCVPFKRAAETPAIAHICLPAQYAYRTTSFICDHLLYLVAAQNQQ